MSSCTTPIHEARHGSGAPSLNARIHRHSLDRFACTYPVAGKSVYVGPTGHLPGERIDPLFSIQDRPSLAQPRKTADQAELGAELKFLLGN